MLFTCLPFASPFRTLRYNACANGTPHLRRGRFVLRFSLRWQPKGGHVTFPDGTEPGDTVLKDAEKLAHDKEVILGFRKGRCLVERVKACCRANAIMLDLSLTNASRQSPSTWCGDAITTCRALFGRVLRCETRKVMTLWHAPFVT